MATPARIVADRDHPPNHERIVEALERFDPTTARALRAMVDPEAIPPPRLQPAEPNPGVG